MMDTGAGSSFLRAKASEAIRVDPVEEADKGRRWTDAGDHEILQQDVSTVNFLTEDYQGKKIKIRRSDQVHNNIGSFAEISDTGTFPMFTSYGGHIAQSVINKAVDATLFKISGNVYKLPMWIPIAKGNVKMASTSPGRNGGGASQSTKQAAKALQGIMQNGSSARQPESPTSQQGSERRDRRGRIRAAGPQPMEVDVVMKESEYKELMQGASADEKPGFTGLGR